MIYRSKHDRNHPYTMVDNSITGKDSPLSIRARGLLAAMLEKPNDWSFSIEGLASILPDGKTTIRSAARELEKHGYLVRRNLQRGSDGKIRGAIWDVYERPVKTSHNPSSEPLAGKPP